MVFLQNGRLAIRGLTVFATSLLAIHVWALSPRIVVDFRGKAVRFEKGLHPIQSQRTVLVPFRETAKLIGAKVFRNPDGKHVTLTFGGDTVYFEPGHHGYKLNGVHRNMRASSESKRGHLFVPIRLFNDLTAGKVHAEIHA